MAKRLPIPKMLRFKILNRDSFTCQYCGAKPPKATLHIDHIFPVKSGGTNNELNLITACFDCNNGKGSSLLKQGSPALLLFNQIMEIKDILSAMTNDKGDLLWLKDDDSTDLIDMCISDIGFELVKENALESINVEHFSEKHVDTHYPIWIDRNRNKIKESKSS